MVQLSINDLEWGSKVLGDAFLHDPMMVHVAPELNKRIQFVHWYMKVLFVYCCHYGEVYSLASKDAVACVFPPGKTKWTYPRMLKVGMFA